MKFFSLLFMSCVFLAFGCNNDEVCGEDLITIEQYIMDNNLTVQEGAEGLLYIIEEPGGVDRPSSTASVTVNYRGVTTNDVVFDETNGSPASFRLAGLIRGWQLGIPLVGEGGRVRLFIPSELGYGSRLVGTICPDSDLIFDIELVSFSE
jgi:FKBP-type peptidyl-prolyl cis-trans isomerase